MRVDLPPPPSDEAQSRKPQRAYIPCPDCGKLMNRRNFAGCSGIVVDWCKDHGIWFDRNELKQAVQFIRGGGLRKSREVEKAKLLEQKLHLKEEQRNLARISRLAGDERSCISQFNSGHELLAALMETWAKSRS